MSIVVLHSAGSIASAEKNLYVERLQTEESYTEINIGRVKIVSRYNYIVHTVNLNELDNLVHHALDTVNLLASTEYSRLAKDEDLEMEKILRML
ncbi:hypothetical protein EVAR_91103_1 [Eumeta japonica]|uniref:Uncharacterized protein n=1 Tax=Eumeta variegata TaxID=151549 RepID=A0A4C1SU00_EUMVA|nr:hypothetical protein EVAR_91103_1 [Eumeta japonica]